MKIIGIITYHSAYNYGSVLQAYATQKFIEKLGYYSQIINYRMPSQKKFYSMYRGSYGYRTFVQDVLQLPAHFKRKHRIRKFESFISNLDLTTEINEPDELYKFQDSFDVYISGSDQIWNKHSCELENVDCRYMKPYLLSFTEKKKISYASSTASMTDEEIEDLKLYLQRFDKISCRERETAIRLQKIVNSKVENVLDPTLLLNNKEWQKIIIEKNIVDYKYIFYYSLKGFTKVNKDLKYLIPIAKTLGIKIICVSPFAMVFGNEWVKNHNDAGPNDFLKLIRDAEVIITDSFHGTAFSINFGKLFYCISNGKQADIRKNQLVYDLGLENQLISSIEELTYEDCNLQIDYSIANSKLLEKRKHSMNYLKNAIDDIKV